nr:hypothetical protein [Tanacetum cinerariifolium]
STKGEADNVVEGSGLHNDDEESDTEADLILISVIMLSMLIMQKYNVSSDPFNIYGLLNNRKKDNGTARSNTTPPFPPGFTPEVRQQGNVDGNLYTDNRSCGFKRKEGGSILDILDEMIK